MAGSNVILLGVGLLVFWFVVLAVAIADYVVKSLGMYRLASRYQVESPWMAWIPVVKDLLIGKLTETHDLRNGAKRKWSTLMLVLSLVNTGGIILFYVIYIVMIVTMSAQTVISNSNMTASLGVFVIMVFIAAVFLGLSSVAYLACSYICIYKNIEAIAPNKTIKYFLLSILVPFAYGIILMKCCKKGYIEPIETPVQEMQQDIPLETQKTEAVVDYEYNVVPEDALEEE